MQPKRKSTELAQQISSFARQPVLDELTFRRLERECLQLTQLSAKFAVEGHILLGILYANMGRRTDCTAHFDRLLSIKHGSRLRMRCNTSVCYIKLGLLQQAVNVILEIESLTDNPEILGWLLTDASQCGMYVTANRLLERLGKMEKDKALHERCFQVPISAELLAARGLTEQDLIDRQAVAADIAFSTCGVIQGSKVSIVEDALLHAFVVRCSSMQKLVEADWAIAEQLTTQFDDPLSDIITFSTLSYSEQERSETERLSEFS